MQYQKTKNLTKKVISLCKLTQKQKNLDPKPASKIAQKGKKGSNCSEAYNPFENGENHCIKSF